MSLQLTYSNISKLATRIMILELTSIVFDEVHCSPCTADLVSSDLDDDDDDDDHTNAFAASIGNGRQQ